MHSSVTVLIDHAPSDASRDWFEERIAGMLEPFNENREVPRYQTKCYCVGEAAKRDVRRQVEAKFPVEELRKKHQQWLKETGTDWYSDAAEDNWDELAAPAARLGEELFANHPLKDSPDEECVGCSGTGTITSTYNKKAKWDWYEIGGRFTGALGAFEYKPWEDPQNIETCSLCNGTGTRPGNKSGCNGCKGTDKAVKFDYAGYDGDIRPVSEIPFEEKDSCITFAILTPDGRWLEQGKLGWFGYTGKRKRGTAWHDEARQILREHKDCIAVLVDVHI